MDDAPGQDPKLAEKREQTSRQQPTPQETRELVHRALREQIRTINGWPVTFAGRDLQVPVVAFRQEERESSRTITTALAQPNGLTTSSLQTGQLQTGRLETTGLNTHDVNTTKDQRRVSPVAHHGRALTPAELGFGETRPVGAGGIPIRIQRADGAYEAAVWLAVVAAHQWPNDPALSEDEYFTAGGVGGTTRSFALSDATTMGTVKLKVKAGFLDSTSFSETTTNIVADGVVYLKITVSITGATWSVTNRERIVAAGDIPANDATHFYFPLGFYHLDGGGALVVDTGDQGKGDQIFELKHCPNFYTYPLTYGDTPTWSPG